MFLKNPHVKPPLKSYEAYEEFHFKKKKGIGGG